MKRWAILVTDPDGTNHIFGPFTTDEAARKAQTVIDKYTDCDTAVIPMTEYVFSDFSIYT